MHGQPGMCGQSLNKGPNEENKVCVCCVMFFLLPSLFFCFFLGGGALRLTWSQYIPFLYSSSGGFKKPLKSFKQEGKKIRFTF